MPLPARLAGASLLLAALLLVGCKPTNPNAPARVTGRVTYNGNPVTGGTIHFHSADGASIPIGIGPDGTYRAFDIPDGDMVVTVETESINPEKKPQEYRGANASGPKYGPKAVVMPKGKGNSGGPKPEESGASAETTYMKIPAKYADKATSGLTVTLKKGDQTHDIKLTD
jgi:hypothetical protein